MIIASETEFEAKPGQQGLYSRYEYFRYFQRRVAWLKTFMPPAHQRILVVGCAFGYLVRDLLTAKYDAYGVDASEWAIARARVMFSNLGHRFSVIDITKMDQCLSLLTDSPFDLVLDEDVMPCLTDAEAVQARDCMRALGPVIHLVTPGTGGEGHDPRLNWKPISEWSTFLSPDVVVNAESI